MPTPPDPSKQTTEHSLEISFGRPQSRSPFHDSKPLLLRDPEATTTAGSNQDAGSITGSSSLETTTSLTSSSHVDPSGKNAAISKELMIIGPTEASPAVTQLGVRRDVALYDHNISTSYIPLDLAHAGQGPRSSELEDGSTGIYISESITQTNVNLTQKRSRNAAWDGLHESLEMLKSKTNHYPALSSVIESLLSCFGGIQEITQNRTDYEDLTVELTRLSNSLQQQMIGSPLTWVSDSVTSAVISIEDQVNEIKERLKRATKGITDEEELVRHYRRIETHFLQLQINASMSTRSILDEHLADTRLKELNPSKSATYDSSLSTEINRRGCTEGTRIGILSGLNDWLNDPAALPIYWMNGMAGTGKTTIASTFCERVEYRKLLAASFFCTRSSAECRIATRIIPTIAYQLARYSIPYQYALCKVLERNPKLGSKNIPKQFEQLLKEPLQQVKDAMPERLLVVVDALDECDDRNGVELILDMLCRYASQVPLKFLITSRPEPEIYDKMSNSKSHQVVHLHDIENSLVQADIELYLNEELAFMTPNSTDIEQLVQRSGTLFIYASTLVRYIRPSKRSADPFKRLQSVLSITPSPTTSKRHTHIDALYTAVLKSALGEAGSGVEEAADIWAVLRTVLSAQEPISIETISTLANINNKQRVIYALHPLRSILHQSEKTEFVSTLHASFPDFMFNSQRSGGYFCDIIEHSQLLVQKCFLVMKEQLRFNICGLMSSFLPDEKVEDIIRRIKENISPTLAYACRYWADHLASAPESDILRRNLEDFLFQQILFWMEVLSLRRELIMSAETFLKAKQWLTKTGSKSSDLMLLVEDAHNFVAGYMASPALQSTPHIYVSLLPLCPQSSLVYKHYWGRTRGLLKLKGSLVQNRETAALAIWDVGASAYSVACSPDGSRVAVGTAASKVIIQNAYDGMILIGPLEALSNVKSVAFSPDGINIASASAGMDCSIRVWNAYNGTLVTQPFEGHTSLVLSLSFSPDGTTIVSGSSDHTIRLWNVSDGACPFGPLGGHARDVCSVTFSPNGELIASGSDDKTARLWNAQTGSIVSLSMEHTGAVNSVAFTPDGTRLVTGGNDGKVHIWNVIDQSLLASSFEGHTKFVRSVAVSPDGTRVASGSMDGTVRVWRTDNGALISGPFFGHTDGVTSVAYSPDGSRVISGSIDKTIRVWNVRDNTFSSPPFPPPTSVMGIKSLAFSSKSTHFLSGHADGVIRVWDISDGSFSIGPVKAQLFPPPLSDISPDSSYIASTSEKGEMQVVSTANGSVIAGPYGFERSRLSTVRFSHNSSAIIMARKDGMIKVGFLPNHHQLPLGSFMGHRGEIKTMAESPDCSLIISYSDADSALRVWSLFTPTLQLPSCTGSTLGSASGVNYSVLYEEWRITKDGWVVNASQQLLFWLPANLASAWWSPYATLVITEAGTLQVPVQKPLVGDQWTKCYLAE
ncbi:unnamed protein product [Rhizoctonia solani]|uniref:NACHT domain-containing protein n=1 Tax=Rhizoctonia solani TaxID=456999 RepID=A0A8H3C9H9_9AGAM|nr:unnamed protein product [Rhizoctonia solani]